MNNLMLTNVVPPKMALPRNKSDKGNLLSSALITFTFISAITLLSFSQEAKAATTEKPAHLVSVESVKKEQVNPSIWLPANVISRKNAPISAEQTGQLLWIEDVVVKLKKASC